MARLLFNRLSQSFSKAAFIDDVQGGQAQQQLVGALRALGMTGVDDRAPAAGLLTRLQELVAAEPVLLVVDNVWTADQLDGLVPTRFHSDSLLVVTSRFTDLAQSASYRVRGPAACQGCCLGAGVPGRRTILVGREHGCW
jgi:hypothetical protein